MSEESIVPFASPAFKRASDAVLEKMRGVPAEQDPVAIPNMDAIENILKALEGMQAQVSAMTDLLLEYNQRIEKLERKKIIKVVP